MRVPFAIANMSYCRLTLLILVPLLTVTAQSQVPDGFHWVDLKREVSTVANIENALKNDNYTALREIGLWGEFALVITAWRESGQATPTGDEWVVYSVSTRDWNAKKLMSGYNLEIKDWISFQSKGAPDLGVVYMDCWECEPGSLFTALHYDFRDGWRARWANDKDPNHPGVVFLITDVGDPYTNEDVDQVFAVIAPPDGAASIGTWYYSKDLSTGEIAEAATKFSVDQATGKDKAVVLSGLDAKAWESELCKAAYSPVGLSQGQSRTACKRIMRTEGKNATASEPSKK